MFLADRPLPPVQSLLHRGMCVWPYKSVSWPQQPRPRTHVDYTSTPSRLTASCAHVTRSAYNNEQDESVQRIRPRLRRARTQTPPTRSSRVPGGASNSQPRSCAAPETTPSPTTPPAARLACRRRTAVPLQPRGAVAVGARATADDRSAPHACGGAAVPSTSIGSGAASAGRGRGDGAVSSASGAPPPCTSGEASLRLPP